MNERILLSRAAFLLFLLAYILYNRAKNYDHAMFYVSASKYNIGVNGFDIVQFIMRRDADC